MTFYSIPICLGKRDKLSNFIEKIPGPRREPDGRSGLGMEDPGGPGGSK